MIQGRETVTKLQGESPLDAELRPYARFYGYAGPEGEEGSLRRFKEHVKGKDPRLIEVTYDRYSGYVFHCESGGMKGPMRGGSTWVMLPPGDWSLYPILCSAPFSGNVYVEAVEHGKRHTAAQVWVNPACSGDIVELLLKAKP